MGVTLGDGEIGATPTEEEGERSGLTGETAIDSGTGDEDSGVEPVGVVLPLAFFWNKCSKQSDNILSWRMHNALVLWPCACILPINQLQLGVVSC